MRRIPKKPPRFFEELNVQAAHMEEVVKGLLKIVGNVSRQHTAQQKHPSAGNKALIGA